MTYTNGVDQIYIPPLADLIVLQDELISRYPQLSSRAKKAVDIIVERRLSYEPDQKHWVAESKRDGGRLYPQIANKCPDCPDYNSTFSPLAGNQRWCKHKLAKRMYTEHLERQINDRLVSPTISVEVTEGMLRTDGLHLCDAYRPQLICRMRRDKEQMIRLFDSEATYQFSLWMLEQITVVEPLAVELPVISF